MGWRGIRWMLPTAPASSYTTPQRKPHRSGFEGTSMLLPSNFEEAGRTQFLRAIYRTHRTGTSVTSNVFKSVWVS